MDHTLKIVRYTLAALMAGVSFILNANAATLHINAAEINQTAVVSQAITNASESNAREFSRF